MANASRDGNNIPVRLGVSSSDGVTTLQITADPSLHAVMLDDNTTGTDLTGDIAPRDANNVPAMLAVSSVDGTTPVALYVNNSGELLVDSF